MRLKDDFSTAYREAANGWQNWWEEADKDLQFYLGDQWSNKDKQKLANEDRDPETYNRIKRIIGAISGYQRKNRLSLRVESVTGSDDTATQLSTVLQWQMNYESAYILMSEAFQFGALTTGINWIEPYMDYSADPISGNIKYARIPYNGLVMDPAWTMRDLGDCQYILRRNWVSKDEARAIIPGHSRQIKKMTALGPDGKFPNTIQPKSWKGKPLHRMDVFYRREQKKTYSLLNKMTGQITPFDGTPAQLDAALQQDSPMPGVKWGQMLQRLDTYKKTCRVSYLLDDEEMYDGPDPLGLDDYPFVPVVGYFAPEGKKIKWKLQGITRTLRCPQIEANRRRLKILDMLDSQLMGIKVEIDALVDPNNILVRGQGATYIMKKGRINDLQPIIGPPLQAGALETMQSMDTSMDELIGMSAELSGVIQQGEVAQSFILAKLREGASITGFQELFDSYRDSKKLLGTKTVALIQANYKAEKIMQIIKRQPSPEFFNRNFGMYDCTPCEGALTDSQKKMRYGEALALKGQGAPIPWSKLLELSSLEIAPELLQGIHQQEQMQQQLMMGKMQMELAGFKISQALDQAKAQAATAKAGYDTARSVEVMKKLQQMEPDKMMDMIRLMMEIEAKGHFGVEGLPQQPQQQGNVIPIRQQMSNQELMTTR